MNVRSGSSIESVLQCLKISASLPGLDDDLAVDPTVRQLQCGNCLRQVLQLRRPIVTAAREKSDVVTVHTSQHTITVELDLVDPIAPARCSVHQCRKLWRKCE